MELNRKKLGKDYPFTVPSGTLKWELSPQLMEDGTPIPYLFFEAEGVRYAVNGHARASGQYRDYEEIRATRPGQPTKKVGMDKFMAIALNVLKTQYPEVYRKIA